MGSSQNRNLCQKKSKSIKLINKKKKSAQNLNLSIKQNFAAKGREEDQENKNSREMKGDGQNPLEREKGWRKSEISLCFQRQ